MYISHTIPMYYIWIAIGLFLLIFKSDTKANSQLITISEPYKQTLEEALSKQDHEVVYHTAQKLTSLYSETYPDSALVWARVAYRAALSLKDPNKQLRILVEQSELEFLTQKYGQSIITAKKAKVLLRLSPNDSIKVQLLYRLGEGYEYTARPEEGMEMYRACYEIAEAMGYNTMLSRLDMKMGNIHKVNDMYALAEAYYKKMIARSDKNDPAQRLHYYAGRILCYDVQMEAPEIFNLELRDICENINITLEECSMLGLEKETFYLERLQKECLVGTKDPSVLAYDLASISSIKSTTSNQTSWYYDFILNAKIALQQKKYKQTNLYLEECDKIITNTEGNIDMQSNVLFIRKELHSALGEYDKAYKYTEAYYKEKSKLAIEERLNSISILQTELVSKEKEKEILLLQQSKKLLDTKAQIYSIIIACLGALVLLAIIFFLFGKQKNKLIAEKNTILKQQKIELENTSATKDKLFSIIGHDLKNTGLVFQSISQKVNYLIDNDKLDTLKALAEEMDITAYNFNKLLNNLLTWTLVQKNEMLSLPIELNIQLAAREIINIYTIPAREKEVDIAIDIPETLIAKVDPQVFRSILLNLIDNAIKFCEKGDKITIHARKNGDKLLFRLSDTGVGMNQEQIDRLFSFDSMQTTRGTAGEKGVGFGLPLIHELVQREGGSIQVLSKPQEGSTFEVELRV